MKQYKVEGMTCAACQARVEKAVSSVANVTGVSVSLLTNSMNVEGDVSDEAVICAVTNAGYKASLKTVNSNKQKYLDKLEADEEALEDRSTPVIAKRLIVSVVFLLILMYFSMGHMMWGWPLPAFFDDNHVAMGLIQMVLAAVVMVVNQRFFISGFKSLLHGGPNMDTLIAIGSSASFIYSTVMLFLMTRAQADGNTELVNKYMMEFYFETAAMILTLITVGKMLESFSKGKTTNALKSLMKLAPKTANVIRDGKEITISIDELETGELFIVRPGENIPADGIVIEGESAVNEASLTGESIPVDKKSDDKVSSATINQSGALTCKATGVGENTTFAQIINMVSEASSSKAPVAKLADTISGYFVPVVIAIAVVTFIIWMVIGRTVGFSLARAISVLVVSCPCALGLATPVAIMVGNGVGAKNGILFKNATALQETGKTDIVALDKTGTITKGEPEVTDIIPEQGVTEDELMDVASALERMSEHPLAKAIIKYKSSDKLVDNFKALPGNGVAGNIDDNECFGGSYNFIKTKTQVSEKLFKEYETLASEGKTPLFFAVNGKLLGIIAVADKIKEDSSEAIAELKKMGIYVIMLTGDNNKTAEAIGKIAGVDEVVAGVMPQGKQDVIKSLKRYGKVMMVGDGINDAPSLTTADIGVSVGSGTDVAIDASDIVLMKNSLKDVPAAIKLSKKTYKNILENLFWALIYNTILIPIAAGLFVHFGLTMDPMFGALAMSLSSFCVVSNALRLNLVDIYKTENGKVRVKRDGKLIAIEENTQKGDQTMTKTIKIEGMMCGHCESTVKKALEAIDGVSEAVVSHDKGTAVVSLDKEIADEIMIKAVEDRDFKVLGIE